VGQADDLPVSAPAKTAGSVLAGSVLAISGVAILFSRCRSGLVALRPTWCRSSLLWVVGMAQAVNLIDGLNGWPQGRGIGGGDPVLRRHLDNADSIISDDNIGARRCVVGAARYLPERAPGQDLHGRRQR
jgi:UDP-GlcNAc:undecaprenyl-phosphate GlcNAc-1-phosphate transferase